MAQNAHNYYGNFPMIPYDFLMIGIRQKRKVSWFYPIVGTTTPRPNLQVPEVAPSECGLVNGSMRMVVG